ncbi:MAG: hypothetical protein VB027_05900 [Gordonibacter sp.]|nr:hypothetical protein [Gordonibacter sp.]
MKACPVCHARTFDDAEICYGCMYRYEGARPTPIPVGRHASTLKDVDSQGSSHRETERLQGACLSVPEQGDDVRRGQHVVSVGAEQEKGRLVDCLSFDGAGWAVRVEFVGREECDTGLSRPNETRSPNVFAGAVPSSSTESLAGSLPLTIHICPNFDAEHKARGLLSERTEGSVSCCTEKDYAKQVVGA